VLFAHVSDGRGDFPVKPGRYLVTGAAGFIGSHLCERLLEIGCEVVGIDRFAPFYDRHLKERNLRGLRANDRFELIEADLCEFDLPPTVAEVDGVFHLAAQAGVRSSWGEGFVDYVRDNVLATQRLLDAVCCRPVPVVIASSSSVYGDADRLPVTENHDLAPVSPYGLTKLSVEHLARIYGRQHGLRIACLRYFTVYGPRQRPDMAFSRFLRAALAGDSLRILGDGAQSRDFTYVDDAVSATMLALDAPAGIYNVGGGEPVSVNAVIELIGELLDRPIAVERREVAAGDVRHTWADTARLRKLGWQPRTSLRDGLEAHLRWTPARGRPRLDGVPVRP
jgi:nucleoside-diphosphate-sugar epimerase